MAVPPREPDGTEGTATLEMIYNNGNDTTRFPGCIVKNDENLWDFIKPVIRQSADKEKFKKAKYYFYTCDASLEEKINTVTRCNVTCHRFSKPDNAKSCIVSPISPSDIAKVQQHIFIPCEFNDGEFLKKHAKKIREAQEIGNTNKNIYGLSYAYEKKLNKHKLKFIHLTLNHGQQNLNGDVYCVVEGDYGKLVDSGPVLLGDNTTVVGSFEKKENDEISISIFGKNQAVGDQNDGRNDNHDGTRSGTAEQQETTSASNTDGSIDVPSSLDNSVGQAAAGPGFPSETGEPSESGESSVSSTEQATSENRLNGSPSKDPAFPDQHHPTTDNVYLLSPRTKGNFTYAKPLTEQIKKLNEQKELQKKNGQLIHENEKLEEQIRQLKQQINEQFEQQKKLEVENKRFKQWNDRLKERTEKLEHDKRLFRQQKKELIVENKRLEKQNNMLEVEKIRSKEHKEKLEGEIRNLKQEKNLVQEKNRQLLRQEEQLEEEKRQYEQKQRKLENKNRQLFRQKNKIKEDRRRYFITSIVLFVIILLIVSVILTIVVVLVVHHKEAYKQFSIN